MLRTVFLHGHLAREFGDSHRFDVATAAEALRALNCAFPGKFIAALREGAYRVIRGREHDGVDLDLNLIAKFNLGSSDLHLIPIAEGAKSGGTSGAIKTIAGVALIGTAIFLSGGTLAAPLAGMSGVIPGLGALGTTWGTLATIGLGMTLMGISTALARPDKPKTEDASFNFNGPMNTNEQGNPVPLIYGEVITGGQPISVGFDIEQIGVYQNDWTFQTAGG